jgi:uncharacterized membrane protein
VATIKESIDVNVPVSTAYNQWTQFEEFPQFMDGVESVRQIDDAHLMWKAEIGGESREWPAEIIEQVPDRKIAWRAQDGGGPDGVVEFQPIGEDQTRVAVEMTYEPEGMKEQLGSKMGLDSRQVKGDLDRFKELIESRGVESGAYREEIRSGEPQ